MDPLIILIGLCVLLTVFALVASLARKTTTTDTIASRLEALRGDAESKRVPEAPVSSFKQKRSYSGFPVLSTFLAQFKGSEAVALHLERSGLPLRVGEYYLIRYAVAVVFFTVPLLIGFSMFNFLVGLGLGAFGYLLPAIWVNGKKNKRMVRINGQLVDMLGMVSNSLKSGYGLMQSFEFAARQMDAPLSVELRRMLREANLGLSAEQALNSLGERIDSNDLDMVLTAINIQRAVGGNLSEILDQVAFTMRERERIRGEISTLTAQQKMTAIVVGGLPFFMFAIFMVMNPDYMSLLFTTMSGRIMMGVAFGLEGMGVLAIKRLIAIDL